MAVRLLLAGAGLMRHRHPWTHGHGPTDLLEVHEEIYIYTLPPANMEERDKGVLEYHFDWWQGRHVMETRSRKVHGKPTKVQADQWFMAFRFSSSWFCRV